MHRIRAVIFDCDGTLVDSEELGFDVIYREACRIGVRFAPGEELIALRGKSMATCLAVLESRLGRPLPLGFEADLRKAMAEAFRAHLRPMPGAVWLMNHLRVPFCVASNGPRMKTELTLEIAGLLSHFQQRIFSAYEIGSFKPDPGLFLAAAIAMGVHPSDCAVVEDSVPGMVAGLEAGMTVYTVSGTTVIPAEIAGRVRTLQTLESLALEPWNNASAQIPNDPAPDPHS